jgi:hypothetical protein
MLVDAMQYPVASYSCPSHNAVAPGSQSTFENQSTKVAEFYAASCLLPLMPNQGEVGHMTKEAVFLARGNQQYRFFEGFWPAIPQRSQE